MQKKISLKNLDTTKTTHSQENFDTKYYINEATSNLSETVRACNLCSN